MRRSLLLLVVAAACGGTQKSTTPPPPLPEEKAEAPKPPPEAPPKAEPPPEPKPLDVVVASPKVTVKLVNAGKGKKAPLKFAPKAGLKQQVELALDFRGKSSGAIGDGEEVMHTVVLAGESEVKSVDKDGNADYQLTVKTTDARSVEGARMSVDQAKGAIALLQGLAIAATVSPNGSSSDVKLHMDAALPAAEGVIKLVQLALPTLPILPKEPIGAGAKWQVTWTRKLADQLEVTQTTDYQLVSKKGNTWTLKATSKIAGTEQTIDTPATPQQPATKAKFSKITGSGTLDVTMTDGALYPTLKAQESTGFTVSISAADKQVGEGTLEMKQGATITPKS